MNAKTSVEVACLIRGEPTSVRHLSIRGERLEVLMAAGTVGAAVLAAMLAATAIAVHAGRVLYAPVFLPAWIGAVVGAAWLAARRARARASCYSLGTAIDADAYGSAPVDLVRRAGDGYEVALVPGMSGVFESGRSPLPVEALTQAGPVRVSLPRSGRAELNLGPCTFVVRWTVEPARRPQLAQLAWKRFSRIALASVQMAAVATVLCAVPAAASISEADMRSAIPAKATPWEAEKFLRFQAQIQSHQLHRCFDPLPMECQRPGFVAIGMSLSKLGEVKSHWVARSTYGADCPVSACMEEIAAGWFFEPLPEAMPVILPVQVLRTGRQLLTLSPSLDASLP